MFNNFIPARLSPTAIKTKNSNPKKESKSPRMRGTMNTTAPTINNSLPKTITDRAFKFFSFFSAWGGLTILTHYIVQKIFVKLFF